MTAGSPTLEAFIRLILKESLESLKSSSRSPSLESQKLNEATEQMMSFWSESPHPRLLSFFEKFDGVFPLSDTEHDIDDDDDEKTIIRAPPNSEVSVLTPKSSSEDVAHSADCRCICFNCWGTTAAENAKSKTWKSPDDVDLPVLTVSTDSPPDSLPLTFYSQKDEGSLNTPITPSGEKKRLLEENELLQQKVKLQNEVIQKLLEMARVSDKIGKRT